MHTHTDLLNNSPLPQTFTWVGNKRQRRAFLLEQTDHSWFAKPLDFGNPPAPSPSQSSFPLSSAHNSISSPNQVQAAEIQVFYGPKGTQTCFCEATANLTYPVPP